MNEKAIKEMTDRPSRDDLIRVRDGLEAVIEKVRKRYQKAEKLLADYPSTPDGKNDTTRVMAVIQSDIAKEALDGMEALLPLLNGAKK